MVGRFASILIGLVFLLAALSKLGDLGEFQRALAAYNFIPFWLQGLTVLLIPGLELSVGLYLLMGIDQRAASFIGSILMLLFVGLAIYRTFFAIPGGCHCFKIQLPQWLELNGSWIILRNLLLLSCSLLSFFWARPTRYLFQKDINDNRTC